MLDRRSQDYRENLADKHAWLDQLWLTGKIGDATFLRSLFIDGIRPDEAAQRLRDLQGHKRR